MSRQCGRLTGVASGGGVVRNIVDNNWRRRHHHDVRGLVRFADVDFLALLQDGARIAEADGEEVEARVALRVRSGGCQTTQSRPFIFQVRALLLGARLERMHTGLRRVLTSIW